MELGFTPPEAIYSNILSALQMAGLNCICKATKIKELGGDDNGNSHLPNMVHKREPARRKGIGRSLKPPPP